MQLNAKTKQLKLTATELRQLRTAAEVCEAIKVLSHLADDSTAAKEAAEALDYLIQQFSPEEQNNA